MKYFCLTLLLALTLTSCIQDDIVFDTVEPELRITQSVDTIALGTDYQFDAIFLNNVGVAESIDILWESTAPDIISIDADGLATALQEGSATITASFDDGTTLVQDAVEVHTGQETISLPSERSGVIRTTTFYLLEGDFTIREEGSDLVLDIAENYRASTALPGLYIYLTNNPNTIANALEIGEVETFNGAHTYTIPNTSLDTYNYVLYFCKPFNVKVGDGQIQ
ncbi:MAG: Ig-like domain-containing protein [Bacteroidota bacterium]